VGCGRITGNTEVMPTRANRPKRVLYEQVARVKLFFPELGYLLLQLFVAPHVSLHRVCIRTLVS
jgi:hypothetical protein